MKKLYMAPSIISTRMDEEEMICTSLGVSGTTQENNITAAEGRSISAPDLWAEEEE